MRTGFNQILANAETEVDYVIDFVNELSSIEEVNELSSIEETEKLWRAWSGILEHYVKAVSAMRRATDIWKFKGMV